MTDEEKERWFTTCEFCGKQLLTLNGVLASVWHEDKIFDELELACDCPEALEKQEQERLEDEKRKKELEARRWAEWQKEIFEHSGMPAAFEARGMKLWRRETQEQREAYDKAAAFGAAVTKGEETRGLYISGGVGAGKTFLASCLVRDLHRRGKYVTWAQMGNVLKAIKASFDQRSTEDVLRKYQETRILVLDDLGKERPTEWVVEQLFNLVNYRYDEGLPLIITTNYGADGLVKKLTPKDGDEITAIAIVDRLCEMCENIQLKGRSFRQSTR